jgi:hypothetical protein
MKDDLRYVPSDCFDTFPLPSLTTAGDTLKVIGREYCRLRGELMLRTGKGLTIVSNGFHDPDEHSPDIRKLRELHAEMDRAVLEAYGWRDLAATATCEFLLDYEDEDEDEETSGRRRKKPWHYRWPDEFRDEVLARLLELNRVRAEEERLAGEAAAVAAGGKITGKRGAGKKRAPAPALPGLEEE